MDDRARCCLPIVGIFVFFGIFAGAFKTISPPDKVGSYSKESVRYYYEEGNFTLHGRNGEPFIVLNVNVTVQNGFVVLFTIHYSDSTRSGACNLDFIPQESIVRIYTTETPTSEFPDRVSVPIGQVLCYQILHRSDWNRRWGFIMFRYGDDYPWRRHAAAPLYNIEVKYIAIRSHESCWTMNRGKTMIALKGTNDMVKTSLEKVSFYTKRRILQRDGPEYFFHHLANVTGQNPAGTTRWPIVANSPGEEFCIRFMTFDSKLFSARFEAKILEIPTCNGEIAKQEGALLSPGFPVYPYPHNAQCSWKLKARKGQRISLEFEEIESDCSNDFVSLFGVMNRNNDREVLCGAGITGRTFISKANELTVVFRTNQYVRRKGFLISFKAMGCSPDVLKFDQQTVMLDPEKIFYPLGTIFRLRCKPGYIFHNKATQVNLTCLSNNTWSGRIPFCVNYDFCNYTLTSQTGMLTSPGYEYAMKIYTNEDPCKWTVSIGEGQRILLTIVDIESSCANDYLTLDEIASYKNKTSTDLLPNNPTAHTAPVAEGQETVSGQVKMTEHPPGLPGEILICGNSWKGSELTSRTNVLNIIYQTNSFGGHAGFKLTYKAIGCSQEEIRLPTNAIIINYAEYYPVKYELKIACSEGFIFPTLTKTASLTCQPDGKWKGVIPFCVDLN